ncbi:Tissue inhibitor of metalloproteinase [Paenibacillaceae bacterium GAS479]|nr:Tissue inhibitor of metalloproteinase [Paenibacillaceae bacterium GAS479]
MRKYVGISLMLALLLSIIVLPSPVQACSCVAPGTTQEELVKSDVVFSGKVALIRDRFANPFTAPFIEDDGNPYQVRLVTEAVWKGELGREAVVFTSVSGGSCGFPFEDGQRYLVFAHTDKKGKLVASSCSATEKLTDTGSSKRLVQLGSGQLPLPVEPAEAPHSSTAGWTISILAGGVALAAFVIMLLFRRSRKRS